MEDAGRIFATVVLGQHILVHIVENQLRIPAEEAEALAVKSATADGIPVMMIPVRIAPILVNEHIVDEAFNVKQRVQLFVSLLVRCPGCRFHHQVPRLHIALRSLKVVAAILLDLNDIDIGFLTAQMILSELIVHALGNII